MLLFYLLYNFATNSEFLQLLNKYVEERWNIVKNIL